MTIDEAVRFLRERGVERNPDTIRWWIYRGYLPAIKAFGRWHVTSVDLLKAERGVRQRTEQTRRSGNDA